MPVWNIAHRGARAFAPENTLQAFEKAKKFGCPMFELDVHPSKDGRLIVHHDDVLTRCTDVVIRFPGRQSYFLSDFTYDELRQLDAGSWYVKELDLSPLSRQLFLQSLTDAEVEEFVSAEDRIVYASGAIRLPTLEEALELARSLDMMVNISIKTIPRMYKGLSKAVVNSVNNMHMQNCVMLSSFDHEQLCEVRHLSQCIATGVLTSDRLAKPGHYLRLLDADAYNPGCYADYDSMGFSSVAGTLDPIGIQYTRDVDRGVNVWTCNDKVQMRCLIEAGVTGLISDYANRVRDVLTDSV